jgi:hypothetical protein
MPDRKKIAAIVTEYFAGSHADVIVTKFLKGFPTDNGFQAPRVDVASIYIDQVSAQDIGVAMAAEHGVPIHTSIVGALTLGGDSLAVDGVLLIGEHGEYAWNEKEQQLFPRKYFLEQICGVMATSGTPVPVFNDKHLAYNWHDAMWMIDRMAGLKAPLMAGSSLPVCWRNPWLEHELDTTIDEAVAVGFSGLEIYGFHTLEVLQCMVERRAGGETGVATVTCLEGDDVWQAAEQGRWSRELAEAACAAIENKPEGTIEDHCSNPAVALIEYRDGLRGAALMLDGYIEDLAYAARVDEGRVVATEFFAQGHGDDDDDGPHAHFAYLSLNVEEMFLSGLATCPVERTLLTTGVLEAMLDSRHQGHQRVKTPWLDVRYQCREPVPWRPVAPRPTGACLDPWPPV